MAFRTPVFNTWVQVWRDNLAGSRILYGWSVCQVRGPTSHVESGGFDLEVLFPKHSDVNYQNMFSGGRTADALCVAGYGERSLRVVFVADKGAGFSNEYRLVNATWRPTVTLVPPLPEGIPPVDVTQAPPIGYTALPLVASLPWLATPPR